MLKLKGKPWEIKCFLQYLMYTYGKNATLKEVLEAVNKNVNV